MMTSPGQGTEEVTNDPSTTTTDDEQTIIIDINRVTSPAPYVITSTITIPRDDDQSRTSDTEEVTPVPPPPQTMIKQLLSAWCYVSCACVGVK